MRWAARAIAALSGLAWAVGSACGGGGGSDVFLEVIPPFPQGLLPVTLSVAGGSGDVAIRTGGDLFAVAGTADVTVVSREDGAVAVFSPDVGGGATALLSVVVADEDLLVGDAAGNVYEIDAAGDSTLLVATGAGPITGLAIAPAGFGDVGGSLLAAAGAAGVLRITRGESPTSSVFAAPGESYVDLAFSGTTLFALDASDAEIDTIDAVGAVTSFQGGFSAPVGLAVDALGSEILVADAGDDLLKALPVSGGTPSARAAYDFAASPPSGVAVDGVGALAWVTSGSVVIRGAALPRVDPTSESFGLIFLGPTSGFGDLELDRGGGFLLVANDPDDGEEGETVANFLIAVSRDAFNANPLATNVGESGEELLSLAYDPTDGTIWIGTDRGNVYQRTPDGTVTLLVDATSPEAVLGLELAPSGFGAFGGRLVATTSAGEVLAIDPDSPVPTLVATIETSAMTPALLSDLVFALDGTLYVVDAGDVAPSPVTDSRILIVAPDGGFSDLGASFAAGRRAEGIEIDEGGDRLLVALASDLGDALVEVSLADASVGPLASLDIQAGFFPTGVVYDRLGGAVVREGTFFTALGAFDVSP